MALRPLTAQVRRGTAVQEIPLEDITIGDILLIRPGEQIGLDGVVVAGQSSVNQAAITGESIPVAKEVGDGVLAGSMNERGALEVKVGRLAADSTLARLIKLVEEAQNQQAPTERFIDKAEQYYAAGVILMTILAIIVPPLFGMAEPFADTFYRAMTLMVAASPCALVISTPATVLSAIGNGARRGILFKGGAYVEDAARLKVIAFDKTGTLTTGKPVLTAVLPTADLEEGEVLALAAAVEAKSEHPLAQAILQAAKAQNVAIPEVTDFDSVTGRGARAQLGTTTLYIGSLSFVEGLGVAQTAAHTQAEAWQDGGQTVIALARQTAADAPVQLLALLAIADEVRSNAAEVIGQLRAKGIERIVVLTGDNERVGRNIGAAVGADEVYAALLPEDKLTILKELEAKYGPVAMVGDGVNDAPALAAATIGIAMGAAGSDVALETADVVLMGDDLRHLPYMIGLSHQTRRVLVQNLVFALGVIVVLIGSVLGFGLALPLSVVGHEGSTVLVSLNGLRLLGYRG
jgi:Zn2+/Cd2+-exporting ATPase